MNRHTDVSTFLISWLSLLIQIQTLSICSLSKLPFSFISPSMPSSLTPPLCRQCKLVMHNGWSDIDGSRYWGKRWDEVGKRCQLCTHPRILFCRSPPHPWISIVAFFTTSAAPNIFDNLHCHLAFKWLEIRTLYSYRSTGDDFTYASVNR